MVKRIYIEKKPDYAQEAGALKKDLNETLSLSLGNVRILNRYDIENISDELFEKAVKTILSEPPLDIIHKKLQKAEFTLTISPLAGQFDQRAQSAIECISFIEPEARINVKSSKVYLFNGINEEEFDKIRTYLINPVEAEEISDCELDTLKLREDEVQDVQLLNGFSNLKETDLESFIKEHSLAMDIDDMKVFQDYFKKEGRNPYITELKVCDTYWSDHCRHTTFLTELDEIIIEDEDIKRSFDIYLSLKKELGVEDKPVTLMDMATIAGKYLYKKGKLGNLDVSEEINACSINIEVETEKEKIPYLLQFKNETHNHPTEIEPFGGAATCIGGAIRDPLAGRCYVYQAMRLSGSGDPNMPYSETMEGKLPQKKIAITSAAGNSSYGNQIGLATGMVEEFYHPGFIAKHMELGAVIGAVPKENVIREKPEEGDLVILVGGKTGRDGIGGATGSSKGHEKESLKICTAEVQKGNAPEERKLQRLFRNKEAAKLIIRCNDFGAGGISVAIGELADGILIDLDKIPKKYMGLDGTEIAISESQERMAVVVKEKDSDKFLKFAKEENLEATIVAKITKEPVLVMKWHGKTIVNMKREFLNTNGARKKAKVRIEKRIPYSQQLQSLEKSIASLEYCSRQGLSERFDSTIGRSTVLMPFGGKYQKTPSSIMAALIPLLDKNSQTCSLMSYGYNPYESDQDPYKGAYNAVIEAVSKIIAAGGSLKGTYLSLQEYFGKTGSDPILWSYPAAALLGALQAQLDLEIAAIGGKDSMSGTFEKLRVPNTLIAFAVNTANVEKIKDNVIKGTESIITLIEPCTDFKTYFEDVEKIVRDKSTLSIIPVQYSNVDVSLLKSCFGNKIGVELVKKDLRAKPGSFLIESTYPIKTGKAIGITIDEPYFNGTPLDELIKKYENGLKNIYPMKIGDKIKTKTITSNINSKAYTGQKVKKPKITIPVFPGTNCEYDSYKAFTEVGGDVEFVIVNNLDKAAILNSITKMKETIDKSQILFIPGGFSGGDEPDGSAKFITSFFKNPYLQESIMNLLEKRNGLIGGICNGFQALVKLGLLPYGEFREQEEDDISLTYNLIGRHQSKLVRTRISSKLSPWLSQYEIGDIETLPISHGEGRFISGEKNIIKLIENGQIATQYVDFSNKASSDIQFNPNGSLYSVEGLSSPDGRIFGRMGHVERLGKNLYKNVVESDSRKFFLGAIKYFT